MEDITRQKPQINKYSSVVAGGNTKRTLDSCIGKTIKIKTASNEEVEGVFYTYDSITNCLAIEQKSTQGKKTHSFHIIKISHIKEIVSLTGEQQKDYLPVNSVNVEYLKNRESDAVRGMKQEASKIGVGVTKEAQDIFNALSKTLPCRWSKDTIVVMDEILITPPYRVEDCKANASSSALLARIKKVLEGERRRLAK